jgi:hypothetical protein
MAYSSCAKCGSGSFKLVTQEPSGSRYKINFIQCSSCNAPVGVMDYFNTGTQLEEQKKAVDSLSQRIGRVEQLIGQVVSLLQRR